MATIRKAIAVWNGTTADGKGVLNSSNNFFDNTPYSFKTRFENEDGKQGTNPEELIAAAHAGCFAMALSYGISSAGFTPDELHVEAKITMALETGIQSIELDLTGKVTGMDEAKFNELADAAKVNCPVSKALSAVPISLNKQFIS